MQIDWFTVIAQVINFLILAGLLKRFLYKPILSAIAEREEKINSQLENADLKQEEAEKEREEFRQKNEIFEEQKQERLDKTIAIAKEEEQKMLEEAREEANALKIKLEKTIEENIKRSSLELKQKIGEEVVSITKKILTEVASTSLEEEVFAVFIHRLSQLEEEEKKRFEDVFEADSKLIQIHSAHHLTKKQEQEIENAVKEHLKMESQFQFTTAPDLISGIELIANGYKIGWNLADYLDNFQKSLQELRDSKPEENN